MADVPQWADVYNSGAKDLPDDQYRNAQWDFFHKQLWPKLLSNGASNYQYADTLKQFQGETVRPNKSAFPVAEAGLKSVASSFLRPLASLADQASAADQKATKPISERVPSHYLDALNHMDRKAQEEAGKQGKGTEAAIASFIGGMVGAAPYFALAGAAGGAALGPMTAATAVGDTAFIGALGGATYEGLASPDGQRAEGAMRGGLSGAALGALAGRITRPGEVLPVEPPPPTSQSLVPSGQVGPGQQGRVPPGMRLPPPEANGRGPFPMPGGMQPQVEYAGPRQLAAPEAPRPSPGMPPAGYLEGESLQRMDGSIPMDGNIQGQLGTVPTPYGYLPSPGESLARTRGAIPIPGKLGKMRDFSSTQVELPGDLRFEALKLHDWIAPEHLAGDGLEMAPHVTVRYGLVDDSETLSALTRKLGNLKPFEVELGSTSVFPATAERPTDVLKIGAEGPQLRRLNQQIAEVVPNIQMQEGYSPHMTVAYLQPGAGENYIGLKALQGKKFLVDQVVFSGRNGEKYSIPLGRQLTEADQIRLRERPYGLMGTTSGEPLPGAPPEASAMTWLDEQGKPASLFKEPNRVDQYHEGIHRTILAQGVDNANEVLTAVDPAMAGKMASAIPSIVGKDLSVYKGVEPEEAAVRLFTAVRHGQEEVIQKFVDADGSKEEVLRFAGKQAEAVQREISSRAPSADRNISLRRMQDIRRRSGQTLAELEDDLAVNGSELKLEQGKFFVRDQGQAGYRVFDSKDYLLEHLDSKGQWADAPDLLNASDGLPGTTGLPPTGGPRIRFNTSEPMPEINGAEPPRMGVNFFSYYVRPTMDWYATVAKKVNRPDLYDARFDLMQAGKEARFAIEQTEHRIGEIFKEFKLDPARRHELTWALLKKRITSNDLKESALAAEIDAHGSKLMPNEEAMMEKLRPEMDRLANEFGIPMEKYSHEYLTVMRKKQRNPDFTRDKYASPKEFAFHADKWFSGKETNIETDFYKLISMYVQGGYRQKFTEEALKKMSSIVDEVHLTGEDAGGNVFGVLRDVMRRDVEHMHGDPDITQRALESAVSSFTRVANATIGDINRKLPKAMRISQIELPPRELINKAFTLQYAGALGGKVGNVVRNTLQGFLSWPMMDSSSFATGFKRSLTKEGWDLAQKYGVFTTKESFLNTFAEHGSTHAQGPIMKVAQASMEPQRWSDNLTKSIAFHGFYDQITKATMEAIRTPGYTVKDFVRKSSLHWLESDQLSNRLASDIMRTSGTERADAIGKAAQLLTEKSQWSSAEGSKPGAYKTGLGRVLGQYGNWPMQYAEFLRNLVANPQVSKLDRATAVSKLVAMHAGILAAGQSVGVDMMSDLFLGPMAYGGSPLMKSAISLPTALGNWEDERGKQARKDVLSPLVKFGGGKVPIPAFVPGAGEASAILDAILTDKPGAYLKMLGFSAAK